MSLINVKSFVAIMIVAATGVVVYLGMFSGGLRDGGSGDSNPYESRVGAFGLEKILSLDELTRMSSVVVQGVAKTVETVKVNVGPRPGVDPNDPQTLPEYLTPRYMLVDRIEFEVFEYLKSSGPRSVTVLVVNNDPAATTGLEARVGGSEEEDLEIGQEYVLFLWDRDDDSWPDGYEILGSQGKWKVISGDAIREKGPISKLSIEALKRNIRSAS